MLRRRTATHRTRIEGVLGTRLELTVVTGMAADGPVAERLLLTEIARLEALFSVYRQDSELSCWARAGAPAEVSAELAGLLGTALDWQRRSGGIFNPAVGELSRRWAQAAEDGVEPEPAELADLAAAIAEPRYRIDGRRAVPVGDCRALNFNALAKGLVIDLAAELVMGRVQPRHLLVNLGGDLLVRGATEVLVGLENPNRPYDNEPPLAVVGLADGGMATSGLARRGVSVGGRWRSHVIDPRDGRPVGHVASATVIAATAATADVAATVLSVLPAPEGIAFAEREGLAGCVVTPDGAVHTSAAWARHTRH